MHPPTPQHPLHYLHSPKHPQKSDLHENVTLGSQAHGVFSCPAMHVTATLPAELL